MDSAIRKVQAKPSRDTFAGDAAAIFFAAGFWPSVPDPFPDMKFASRALPSDGLNRSPENAARNVPLSRSEGCAGRPCNLRHGGRKRPAVHIDGVIEDHPFGNVPDRGPADHPNKEDAAARSAPEGRT